MFQFGARDFLYGLLLLPAVLVFMWFAIRSRRKALERFGEPGVVARLTDTVNVVGRRIRLVFFFPILALLVTALARPQFGSRVETVRREGLDIVIAIDVSSSMLAEDLVPNRLERAKFAVNSLIDRLDGDRVALVAFAGEAFVQTPLTVDYAAAAMFLNAMTTDMIPVQGTNLAGALDVSLNAFSEDVPQHRVLILITDGEDHEGDFQSRIDRAAEEGVKIFSVGMGSPDGVPIPVYGSGGRRTGFKRDRDGNVVTTRLDEETLRAVATGTGGDYLRASTGSDLDRLADEIDALQGREFQAQQVTRFEEQYQIFLGAALLLLFADAFIPDTRRPRREWKGRLS
jgi:Ca-activated chloride channel family protein